MIYKHYFLLVCFLSCIVLRVESFQYDKAAQALKQGKWDEAYELLVPLVVDNPDRADVLYDAGVAAYNKDKYSQAQTYFVRAAQNTDDNNLKINAYFNAANASIPLKKLQQAIEYYDKALFLDPHNEYAQHNKKCVLEMLKKQEEQKKQDNQKDQDKQDQNDDQKQQDQQQNSDGKDKNNDDQQGDNQQDGQGQQGNDSGSEQNENDNQKNQSENQGKNNKNNQSQDDKQQSSSDTSKEQSDQKEGSDSSDSSQSDAGKNKRDKKQDAANSNDDKKGDRENQFHDQSDQTENKNDGQQGDNHDNSSDKQDKNATNNSTVASQEDKEQSEDKEGHKAQAAHGQGEEEIAQALQEKLNDPWLMNVLQKQEERDKATNKQLMEAKIRQNGGKNGQNCW